MTDRIVTANSVAPSLVLVLAALLTPSIVVVLEVEGKPAPVSANRASAKSLPQADDIKAKKPVTLYVSKLGNKTYVHYAVGDQRTWMNVKRAEFDGTLQQFYERWYTQPGIRDTGDMASQHARVAAQVKVEE